MLLLPVLPVLPSASAPTYCSTSGHMGVLLLDRDVSSPCPCSVWGSAHHWGLSSRNSTLEMWVCV